MRWPSPRAASRGSNPPGPPAPCARSTPSPSSAPRSPPRARPAGVANLFDMVAPHVAYFGAKDAQQALVIQRMVRDLHLPVDIVTCPTVREPDGLAMSSRNAYLEPAERERAVALRRGLDAAEA